MKTEFERLAYQQGRDMNRAGIPASSNPYDEPQPATAWARGWWDSERESPQAARFACATETDDEDA